MEIPTLTTAHLRLRAWTPDDAPELFNILQEDGTLRYFPNPAPPPPPKVDDHIAHHLEHWRKFGYGLWAVITADDGRLAGWCGLEHLLELGETEVAYLLSQRVRGRGYATEAARAAIRFGFQTAGLSAIIGLVHPDNLASIRVLEKCGLVFADRNRLWGIELARYRITRELFDAAL